MLKRDYPIMFDGAEIKVDFSQWDESLNNIVNERETEAGTDSVDVIRFGKRTVTCSAACSARWCGIFENYNSQLVIKVKYYDPAASDYVLRDMRMANFSKSLVLNSDTLEKSNGLYNVSFDLVEY